MARARGEEVVDADWSPFVATADERATPSVVFTDPQVASVGRTAAEAEEAGLPHRVVEYPLGNVAGAALFADGYEGTAIAVVDTEREVLLGVTFVGPGVAELLQAATIAVVGEVPIARLWHAVPAYPTIERDLAAPARDLPGLMPAAMPRIGLVLHPRRDCSPAVGQVVAWTSTHGVELVASAEDVTGSRSAGVRPVPVEELAARATAIIALGGDGTLLGAMRLVSGRPVPVLGVNFGNLGFLAEVEGAELDAALEAMAEGRSTVEMRGCLVVRPRAPARGALAFNDAVLARVPGEGLVRGHPRRSAGQRVRPLPCDALILATPDGLDRVQLRGRRSGGQPRRRPASSSRRRPR